MIQFPILHTLRIAAALAVVFWHVRPFQLYWSQAYLSVDFFFLLSGFMLTYRHGFHLSGWYQRIAPMQLVWQRFCRLWPLHMFGTAMAVSVGALGYWPEAVRLCFNPCLVTPSFWQQVFLTQNLMWLPQKIEYNFQAWSVSSEFWSLIIVVGLLFWSNKATFLIVWFGLWGLIASYFYTFEQISPLASGVSLGLLRGLAGFCGGVVLYAAYEALQHQTQKWSQARKWQAGLVAQLSSLALFMVLLMVPVPDILWLVFFSVAIIGLAWPAGPLYDVINKTHIYRAGDLAYSLYLNHMWVYYLLKGALNPHNTWPGFVVYLGVLVLISMATYHIIERPGIRLGKAFKLPKNESPSLKK